jgi:hypothetical protein
VRTGQGELANRRHVSVVSRDHEIRFGELSERLGETDCARIQHFHSIRVSLSEKQIPRFVGIVSRWK